MESMSMLTGPKAIAVGALTRNALFLKSPDRAPMVPASLKRPVAFSDTPESPDLYGAR